MTGNQDQAQQTGTRNETYDIISIVYHALQGAENCQKYLQDAKDDQLRSFFEQALQAQRQLADQGKQILQQQLADSDQSGGSAFGWDQSGQSQNQFGNTETTSGGQSGQSSF